MLIVMHLCDVAVSTLVYKSMGPGLNLIHCSKWLSHAPAHSPLWAGKAGMINTSSCVLLGFI